MNVTDDMGAGCPAIDVAVEVALLPEPRTIAAQCARGHLLERLEKLRQEDGGRFVDEQVNVLGHEDVSVDAGLMTGTGFFKYRFEDVFRFGFSQEREAVKATEGDEVERFRLLEPLEAEWHGPSIVAESASLPLIAIKLR